MSPADLFELLRQAEANRQNGITRCPDQRCDRMTGEKHARRCRVRSALQADPLPLLVPGAKKVR